MLLEPILPTNIQTSCNPVIKLDCNVFIGFNDMGKESDK